MKFLNVAFLFFLLVLSNGCEKYETQFDGPYSDDVENSESFVSTRTTVLVLEGKVTLMNSFLEDPMVINGNGVSAVASINNEHTKVVFKNNGENISIYDIETEQVVEQIPNTSSNILWMDYHSNNETVFYLRDNGELQTHGPEILTSNPFDLASTISSTSSSCIVGATVFSNGDIAFSCDLGFPLGGRVFITTGMLIPNSNNYFFTANKVFEDGMRNMRLPRDETSIWGEISDTNYILDSNSLGTISDSWNYVFGAPLSRTDGYRVKDSFSPAVALPFDLANQSIEVDLVDEVLSIDY